MGENPSFKATWRTRLATAVATVGAALALTTSSPQRASAATAAPQLASPGFESRGRTRIAKLVFRRTAKGGLRVADHESHESHASHSSHYSGHTL